MFTNDISITIPVYAGEDTLEDVIHELLPYTLTQHTLAGRSYRVGEVLLAYDHGHEQSAAVIRDLESRYPFVRAVWLSRNFGQHPATLAAISQSRYSWVVTMDEDGQHDPADIANLLDAAIDQQADVVYGEPKDDIPHSGFRNVTSRLSKLLFAGASGLSDAPKYQSYRLILGDVARELAQTAGPGAYLDVALGWIANHVGTCAVSLRKEGRAESSYNVRRLLGHFWRMVVTGGTKPLRLVSILGILCFLGGLIWGGIIFVIRLVTLTPIVPGWASLMLVVLITSGLVLFSLGIIAEYLGASVYRSMGKPLFVILSDPAEGPLGQDKDNR